MREETKQTKFALFEKSHSEKFCVKFCSPAQVLTKFADVFPNKTKSKVLNFKKNCTRCTCTFLRMVVKGEEDPRCFIQIILLHAVDRFQREGLKLWLAVLPPVIDLVPEDRLPDRHWQALLSKPENKWSNIGNKAPNNVANAPSVPRILFWGCC